MKLTHLICQEGGCKNNPGFSLLLIRQMALNPSLLVEVDTDPVGPVLLLDVLDALLLLLDAAGPLSAAALLFEVHTFEFTLFDLIGLSNLRFC